MSTLRLKQSILDIFLTEFTSSLWLLFTTSFLSATLLPGGSEANFIYLLYQQKHDVMLLVIVATIGNTLGGMVNYAIGRLLPSRILYTKHTHKAVNYLQKYGHVSLLFSWLPIIGDPLCLMAGWLKYNLIVSVLLIIMGKFLRYIMLAFIVLKLPF